MRGSPARDTWLPTTRRSLVGGLHADVSDGPVTSDPSRAATSDEPRTVQLTANFVETPTGSTSSRLLGKRRREALQGEAVT